MHKKHSSGRARRRDAGGGGPSNKLALSARVLSERVKTNWKSAMSAPSNSGPRPTLRV